MYDRESLREAIWAVLRWLAVVVVVVAAMYGYGVYQRSTAPPVAPPSVPPSEHLAVLRDHSAAPSTRHRAGEALKAADRSIVPDLVAELEEGDPQGRFLAAMVLGFIGRDAADATDAVIVALADDDPVVRRQAAKSLAEIAKDSPKVVASLEKVLRDPDRAARTQAFTSLAAQGDPGVETLVRLLDDPELDLRLRAVAALGRMAGPADLVIKALRHAMDDDDRDVRATALKALYARGAISLKDVVTMIGDPRHAQAAAGLLGEMGANAASAVPDLCQFLQSDDAATVRTAVSALGSIGPAAQEATKDLVALADDRRLQETSSVKHALKRIGLESEFQPPELWQELEAAADDVYSLVLDANSGPVMPGSTSYAVTDADLEHVGRLRNLRLLSLARTTISNDGMIYLSKLSHLERLDLENTHVSSAGIAHLANLRELRSLNLKDCIVDDDGLRYLKILARLESLNLDGARITDAGLAHLSGLTNLRSLRLGGPQAKITDAGMEHLSALVQLRCVWFVDTEVTDVGLNFLRGATELQEIRGGQITPQGLVQFKNLAVVSLSSPSITDADLAPLAELTQLSDLNLNGTSITDAGLESIGHLGQLETLSLCGTAISDAGLVHLKALTRLKNLDLFGDKVTITKQGADDLRTALPNTLIY